MKMYKVKIRISEPIYEQLLLHTQRHSQVKGERFGQNEVHPQGHRTNPACVKWQMSALMPTVAVVSQLFHSENVFVEAGQNSVCCAVHHVQ